MLPNRLSISDPGGAFAGGQGRTGWSAVRTPGAFELSRPLIRIHLFKTSLLHLVLFLFLIYSLFIAESRGAAAADTPQLHPESHWSPAAAAGDFPLFAALLFISAIYK